LLSSSESKQINDKGEAVINLTIAPTDFSKQEKIGEGSFGVVYKGEWEGTTIAIKELRANKMPESILSEFKNEAFIMAKYRHPNIVQLYGVCLTQPYSMIMEFLVNGNLFYYLHDDKVLEWQRKYKIAKDVAAGLSFLHKRNVIHSDIKSLNVFLDQELNAKIGDYGLAKIKTYSANTTAAVGIEENVGTKLWMAPELFKRGVACSSASDVYSYGILLWEIASHKMPFEDAKSIQIAQKWIEEGEKEIIPRDCPTSFSEIINLCWKQL
jgi:serine/threonine protein kinase